MSIADNLKNITEALPDQVKLIAISKFHPPESIMKAYNAGQRAFGESRMQELEKKHDVLPQDIEWHFIGHLQTNKVKAIIPYIHTIHSVDSWKLLSEIERQAVLINKPVCCLIEVHISQDNTKYGFTIENCRRFIAENTWKKCKFAYLGGLMGMATYTDNTDQIRKEFRELKQFFEEIKENHFANDNRFAEISMGMSSDYQIAIEEGATMIRVGSSIFGEREY